MAYQIPQFTGNRTRHRETVPSSTTSTPVWLDWPGRWPLSVAVYTTSLARIEYTLDDKAAVDGGTATWIAWSEGDVTKDTANTLDGPIAAVRCVTGSGSATFVILG